MYIGLRIMPHFTDDIGDPASVVFVPREKWTADVSYHCLEYRL
jgi:hypothetical protein